ncbi:type II toxin -antitoxin system TacA 1-like antitoxin [Nocardia takedensis]
MSVRDDRLQVRVDAVAKRRLEEAASEKRLSLSAFVLQAAQQQADAVLAERETIRLSPDAAAAYEEALSRPAQVNQRLAQSLQRPAKFTWLD